MEDFSERGARIGYRHLMQRRPDWFLNHPRGGITILTAEAEVEQACRNAERTRAAHGLSVADVRAGLLACDPYMTIVRDAVRFPDGSLGLYNRVIETAPVAVLPLLDGRPVLMRVFRHGLRDWSLEFPRGACDQGEGPETGVRRELEEEIGARALNLIPLGQFTPGGSSLSIRAWLFAAEIDGIGKRDLHEGIEDVHAVDIATLEEKIRSNEIIDGFSLALFTRARLARLI
jgi:ADP-ribose pyrophosphatase